MIIINVKIMTQNVLNMLMSPHFKEDLNYSVIVNIFRKIWVTNFKYSQYKTVNHKNFDNMNSLSLRVRETTQHIFWLLRLIKCSEKGTRNIFTFISVESERIRGEYIIFQSPVNKIRATFYSWNLKLSFKTAWKALEIYH